MSSSTFVSGRLLFFFFNDGCPWVVMGCLFFAKREASSFHLETTSVGANVSVRSQNFEF